MKPTVVGVYAAPFVIKLHAPSRWFGTVGADPPIEYEGATLPTSTTNVGVVLIEIENPPLTSVLRQISNVPVNARV